MTKENTKFIFAKLSRHATLDGEDPGADNLTAVNRRRRCSWTNYPAWGEFLQSLIIALHGGARSVAAVTTSAPKPVPA